MFPEQTSGVPRAFLFEKRRVDGGLRVKRVGFARLLARVAGVIAVAVLACPGNAQEQVAAAAVREDLIQPTSPPKAGSRTRFIIGLSHKADYQISLLSNPNRIVVELPNIEVRLPGAASGGVVKSFRCGVAAPGKTRIVIDTTEPVVVESSKIEKDKAGVFNLALDIVPADAALKKKGIAAPSGLGASGLQPPLPKHAQSPKQLAAKAFKPVIVIDPGHGGMDSGAVKRGTIEKDVVLAFSHVLREKLEKTGRYKVLMTRDKDIFIELDERRLFAERNDASLFIAVHADYAGTRARGATIFSLRDGVAKDLERSAKNNAPQKVLSQADVEKVKQSSGDVDAVRGILADLAERDVELTRERSSIFAKTVIETMGEATAMRSEPEQQAAFKVLKTAQFPSVLIELGYVTNQDDADNLKSTKWRQTVSSSIVEAVENYFSNTLARMPM